MRYVVTFLACLAATPAAAGRSCDSLPTKHEQDICTRAFWAGYQSALHNEALLEQQQAPRQQAAPVQIPLPQDNLETFIRPYEPPIPTPFPDQ